MNENLPKRIKYIRWKKESKIGDFKRDRMNP